MADVQTASVCTQTYALLQRELRGLWRNKPALYARFGMTAVLVRAR